MEKSLLGHRGRTIRLILFAAFIIAVFFIQPAAAEGETSSGLSEEKAAEYRDHLENGSRYYDQGKYREAIAEYNRALLLDPSSDEAKSGIIRANQRIAARSEKPERGAIERDRLNFHLTKGTEYFDEEKYDLAIAEWNQALQIDPENSLARSLIEAAKQAKVDLLVEKGHDEFFAGNVDKAIEIWEEAQSIAPASQVLRDLLADAYVVKHEQEMARIQHDNQVESYRQTELAEQIFTFPEGASADGIKRKDVSLRPRPPTPREFGAREAILKELSQPVAFEFECESLRGVLKFLTEITGINILVDEAVFDEFGKDQDCFGNKVDRKEIFVTIHVSELPLESALNGMLRQHGLGFSIERDFIYVSTPDVLRGSSFEQLETRFYHLKDVSRISVPKLETSGTTGGVSLGGRALNLASGQSLISRVREIKGKDLMEIDPMYQALSVPKLVNLLRTFVPVVLDPSKTGQKRATAKVGDDKMYGGLDRSEDPFRLFESARMLWADSNQREILSLIDYDPHTNTLIVRNTPTNLDMVEVFLDQLDHEPRQISVEAKFITYSILEAKKVGIDFTFGGTNAIGSFTDIAEFSANAISDGSFLNLGFDTDIGEGVTGDVGDRGGTIQFRYTKADGDFVQATIDLLEELRNTRVVSAPRIVTLHNKPAVIQDVLTRSFRSNLSIDTNIVTPEAGQTTTTTSIDQEFTDVTEGVTLSITPQILKDNQIRLFIMPDVARIVATDTFSVEQGSQDAVFVNTVTRPQVRRQSLFSNLVINDGDTIVVGGLIQNTSSYQNTGVPFFRDIPLIGRVFENEAEIRDVANLLVFISVNILDTRGVAYTRIK